MNDELIARGIKRTEWLSSIGKTEADIQTDAEGDEFIHTGTEAKYLPDGLQRLTV